LKKTTKKKRSKKIARAGKKKFGKKKKKGKTGKSPASHAHDQELEKPDSNHVSVPVFFFQKIRKPFLVSVDQKKNIPKNIKAEP
jgi:hypothetical protein